MSEVDRLISARVDGAVVDANALAARRMGVTQDRLIEAALREKAAACREIARDGFLAALDGSFGIMSRDEPPEETIRKMRAESELNWSQSWRAGEDT